MTQLVPAQVLHLPLSEGWELHVTPHLPGDGKLTFDVHGRNCRGDGQCVFNDLTVEGARKLRDYLTEWLDGGAR